MGRKKINCISESSPKLYQEKRTGFADAIKKFDGEKTPVHLMLKQKSNLMLNGVLVNGYTEYNSNSSIYINITLNTEQSINRPSLAVARTILHEAIHAEIYRKIKTNGGLSYDSNTNTWKLPNGSRAKFESIFDSWNEDPDNPYHNYMGNYYRNAIESGLKEYVWWHLNLILQLQQPVHFLHKPDQTFATKISQNTYFCLRETVSSSIELDFTS